jgi:hypothetical protein
MDRQEGMAARTSSATQTRKIKKPDGTQKGKSFMNLRAGHRWGNELLLRDKESGQIFVAATETWLLSLHKAGAG